MFVILQNFGRIAGKPGIVETLYDVPLPDGWYYVRSGAVKPGDMHINASLLPIIEWRVMDAEHVLAMYHLYRHADVYTCLIRKGTPVTRTSVCLRWHFFGRKAGCTGWSLPDEMLCGNCLEYMKETNLVTQEIT